MSIIAIRKIKKATFNGAYQNAKVFSPVHTTVCTAQGNVQPWFTTVNSGIKEFGDLGIKELKWDRLQLRLGEIEKENETIGISLFNFAFIIEKSKIILIETFK